MKASDGEVHPFPIGWPDVEQFRIGYNMESGHSNRLVRQRAMQQSAAIWNVDFGRVFEECANAQPYGCVFGIEIPHRDCRV
jgi:hypothetical protein